MIRRRLLLVLPTLLGVAVLVFSFIHLVPGDPVDVMLGEAVEPADATALRHALGLDRPLGAQLLVFLGRVARGDLGESVAFREPVAALVAARLPATLELAAAALLIALVIALPLGIVAAMRRGSLLDRLVRIASLAGVCVPTIWLGPLLVLAFSLHLGWLPTSGRGGAEHLVLPALTLGLGMAGVLVRLTRASVLDALGEDSTRTARAKGAPPWRVVGVHAFRTALGPIVTVTGLQLGALLAGAVVTETIFAWPGLGRLVVQAIGARDYPLVQGCALVFGTTYVVVNACTDVLLAALDPRLRDVE